MSQDEIPWTKATVLELRDADGRVLARVHEDGTWVVWLTEVSAPFYGIRPYPPTMAKACGAARRWIKRREQP